MNEQELKNALRDAVVASSPPPAMDTRRALEAGRAAARKRRATWGGAVAGLAVVGIAVGATLLPGLSGGSGSVQVGGQSERPSTTGQSARPSPSGPALTTTVTPKVPSGQPNAQPGASSKTQWPDGQQDRTATSGPRADKGTKVLNDLSSSLPPGFSAPDKQRVGFDDYGAMRRAQASFEEYVGQTQVWTYWAYTPVVKADAEGVGRLEIRVLTKGSTELGGATGCAAALRATYPVHGANSRCDTADVGGKQVALLTANTPVQNGLEQAALFWHEDGTLVTVAQAKGFANSGHPAMAQPPLTPQQLAALATDPKFHLD
ncbi:hypothetical protein [Saccharothrix coeruleofusca]|uniref:Uncharacterized protein n=1 Tax=Saccharothrix coeruleofusca TaxID=33919 RepID=A0A918ECL4_9PSEU|nr:hypothetical protein [Saccharothrix coeruleofusca]GGP49864.1 hypothetical protein GCM10010185_22570 [Saccharothrix coeruleofusca]